MAGVVGALGDIAGNAAGEAVAFGLGFALGRVLEPVGVPLEQDAWKTAFATDIEGGRALDPLTAAQIVAERLYEQTWGRDEAILTGTSNDRFDRLVLEVQEAPAFRDLLTMLRRGTITLDDFNYGLGKHKLAPRFDTGLTELQTERLDPAVVADGIQRRVFQDPGYLEGALPIEGSNVPILSVANIDPVAEAAAGGIDSDRLGAQTKLSGLPPAPGELLQLLNRGEINEAAFGLGVAQGHTRNEWGPFLLTLKRRLLTPHEYAELNLRGIIDTGPRDAGASLSGMEPADTALLFEMIGRPLAVHAITTGLARGGTYGGTYDDIPEPYRDAVRRSNIRPEYAVLAHANRFNLPSPFVMRSLTQAGTWNEDKAHTRLLMAGWIPEDAAEAAADWSQGVAAKGDPHVAKAETQLWGTLHKAYVDSRADDATADTQLVALGVADTARPEVLDLWKRERLIVRAGLTAAEIRKTVGLPGWTDAERMARLAELGYSTEDATTFLAE